MGFWGDFADGFNSVIDPVKKFTTKIPVVGDMYGSIPKLHKGGKVPKTGNYRLKAGEVVLNKTQLTALKKAKTTKTRTKIINNVKKRRPKKMKHRRK